MDALADLDAHYAAVRRALGSWRVAGRDGAEIASVERAFARAWHALRLEAARAMRRSAA